MDITSWVVKILLLVNLMNLSIFFVDASDHAVNTTQTTTNRHSLPILRTTGKISKKYYYIIVGVINYLPKTVTLYTNFSGVFMEEGNLSPYGGTKNFKKTVRYPAVYHISAKNSKSKEKFAVGGEQDLFIQTLPKPRGRTFYISELPRTKATTTVSQVTATKDTPSEAPMKNETSTILPFTTATKDTSSEAPTKNETSTNLPFTTEHKNVTNHITSTKSPDKEDRNANEHEHRLMFYISVGLGSVLGILLFSLIIILVRRCFRKRKERKERVAYWAKINRACQSQYIPNEEVSSNNPMYEGSRSRTTSNVLYGVPENEDIGTKIPPKNDYVLTPSTRQPPKPDIVISNACALYQNADELRSEPKKVSGDIGSGSHYERIRSFIHNDRNDIRESTGSYAEPCVLLNGMFVSENTGYVSVEHKTK